MDVLITTIRLLGIYGNYSRSKYIVKRRSSGANRYFPLSEIKEYDYKLRRGIIVTTSILLFDSELLEEMFPRYYVFSNVGSSFKHSIT